MLLKQFTKSIFANKAAVSLVNPIKRSFLTQFRNNQILNSTKNGALFGSRLIFSSNKNFFSSNKEEKKESKKDEEHKTEQEAKKEEENKTEQEAKKDEKTEETDKALNEKYKELKTLYNEQEQKLDQVKKKFHEIKDLYLKGIEEIDLIKLRNEREIKNTKDYAITKFAKDLLDVHDNFTRALGVIAERDFKGLTPEEKDETFAMFVEGG